MVVDIEVDKIRSSAQTSAQRSNANFTSQFLSGTQAADFLSKEQSRIFANDAQARVGQFSRETDVSFLRGVLSKEKNLNFGGPQMEFIRRTVEDQGVGRIESMIRRREMSGVMEVKLGKSELNDVFESIGVKGGVNAFSGQATTMPKDASVLKNLLGTGDTSEQSRIVEEIKADLAKGFNSDIKSTGTLSTTFTRKLEEPDAVTLTELLDLRKEQARVLQEQILAERKNLSIQIAQQNIQADIQEKMQLIQRNIRNRSIESENNILNLRGETETRKSFASFASSSPIFKTFGSTSEEDKRQSSIRRKIFDEDMKVRKAEALNTFKREAQRLLSEKNVVDALNNLSQTIEGQLKFAESEGSQVQQGGATVNIPGGGGGGASGAGAGAGKGGGNLALPIASPANEKILKEINEAGSDITRLSADRDVVKKTLNSREGTVAAQDEKIDQLTKAIKAFQVVQGGAQQFMPKATNSKHSRAAENRTKTAQSRLRRAKMDAEQLAKDAGQDLLLKPKRVQVSRGNARNPAVYKSVPRTTQEIIAGLIKTRNETKDQQEVSRGKVAESGTELLNLNNKIDARRQAVVDLEKKLDQDIQEIDTRLKGEKEVIQEAVKAGKIEPISLEATKTLLQNVMASGDLEAARSVAENGLKEYIEANPNSVIAEQAEELGLIFQGLSDGIKRAENAFNVDEAKRRIEEFNKNLDFTSYSSSAFNELESIRTTNIRAASGANIMDKVVDQENRQRNFDIINQDPTSTNAEKARAKASLNEFTIGTQSQRDQMFNFRQQLGTKNQQLLLAEEKKATAKTEDEKSLAKAEIESLEAAITELDQSMLTLAGQMERTTPRDKGFLSEFSENTSMGLQLGFAEIEEQSEQIYTRLGRDLPMLFRDGLVDAMQAALDGSQSLEDSFRQIGISLLQNIQKAFLTSASNRITGAVGSIFGLDGMAAGGMVNGGSGTRDDVPAMLMGGEYVIKKSAVQKYGVNFLENLNNGSLAGYAEGGAVLNIGSPMVAEREKYTDKSKYGNVTRYKTKQAGIGISSQLTGYAIANDRSIQKYFRDQETQFNQDLTTKKQEEARKKQKEYEKKVKKNSIWNMILGIAGSALIGKAVQWGTNKFKGTDFYKNRMSKRADKAMAEQGYVQVSGRSVASAFPKPSEANAFRSQVAKVHKEQGWKAAHGLLQDTGIGGNLDKDGFYLRNKGGGVPTRLTGGEYVMSPSAVKTYGSSLMQGLNSGSVPSPSSSGQGQSSQTNTVTHGDVNISINVDNSGSSSDGADLNSAEFASKVKSAVMNVIAQEKRVGGSLR